MSTGAEIARIIADHGLAILAPLAVIEGPIVTVIAGYLASLSLLPLLGAFAVVVAGDVAGDCILYAFGRGGTRGLALWPGPRLRIPRRQLFALVRGFRRNGTRILVLAKLTHAAGFAVLIAAGAARLPLPVFLGANLLASLPKSAALLALGHVFGAAHERIAGWISAWSWVVMAAVVVALGVWLFLRRRRR